VVRLRFETDLSTSIKAQADLAAAVEKVGDSLGKTAGEARKLELAAKRIVDANLSPQERYNKKVEELAKAVKAGTISMEQAERTTARLRQRLDETAQSKNKAFGPSAVQELASYAAGMFGIGTAVGVVSQAMRQVEADAQRAADRVSQSFGSFAALQQVSGTPEEFGANVAEARGLVSRGIVSPDQQGTAADIVGGLIRARLSKQQRDIITDLGERDVLKSDELVSFGRSAREFTDIFGGSFTANAAKLIQAGQVSSLDIGHLATRAKERGMGGDQFLASAIALLQTAPNERTAATRINDFFEGKHRLDAKQQQVFDEQLSLIRSAPDRGVLGRSFVQTDPQLAAEDLRQVTLGELGIREQAIDQEQEALLDIVMASRRRQVLGRGEFNRLYEAAGQRLIGGLMDLIGLEDPIIRGAARGGMLNESERERIEDYLRRTAESNERMEQSTAPRPSGRQEN
jgi:hypothetical protein